MPTLHKEFLDRVPLCLGGVEQTTRGIWQDRKIGDLRIPVMSISDSELKKDFESPYVGRSVIASIEHLLGGTGSLVGKTGAV